MNDIKIIKAVEKGINNISQSELVNGYLFVTGNQLSGNCSGCVKRKAWTALKRYYDKLMSETLN